jgi:two-component system, chemotaxis family, sensor kinase Cph1
VSTGPAFGQADLTNCERELIHLAGSVQPYGLLLALREPQLRIVQISANAQLLLGAPALGLLNLRVTELGGDIEARVRELSASPDLAEPAPLRCHVLAFGRPCAFEGSVHREPGGALIVELEPAEAARIAVETVHVDGAKLIEMLGSAVERFSTSSSIGILADGVVRSFRDLVGYDRVMVYKFDPDGHGKIIAEARDPRLESLLGHHYPASDIPQRARELYLRNRLRVLVDVHGEAAPLVPRLSPGSGQELDMSMCHLRSMSPLHLQYLKNMGVTATLVISLVREGRLWGLIACHHDTPRNLRFAVRAACDLLAEVVSTRIAAIENYTHAQVAIQVRRLEQRLIEATSTEGDWRLALFRNPRTLLQPLDATAAALFYDGEVLTSGEAPSTPELRALMQWIDAQSFDGLFSCSSVARANPALQSLTPTASGVLAVKLSASRPEYLMWFRKEQLLSVTWGGDPTKPMVGNDPLELSPRRSFAAWSEIVRGTALPWSSGEITLARAFGASLTDIVVQINAVRLLIAEHQLGQIRGAVASSKQPVVIADMNQRVLFANEAFFTLARRTPEDGAGLGELADLFTEPEPARRRLTALARERTPWRGEATLALGAGAQLPVALRAEVVPSRDGSVMGFFLILEDQTESQRAAAARRHLEQSLSAAGRDQLIANAQARGTREPDALISAILANASLAAMDIADGASPAVAPLLEELEASTKRATALYARVRTFNSPL